MYKTTRSLNSFLRLNGKKIKQFDVDFGLIDKKKLLAINNSIKSISVSI